MGDLVSKVSINFYRFEIGRIWIFWMKDLIYLLFLHILVIFCRKLYISSSFILLNLSVLLQTHLLPISLLEKYFFFHDDENVRLCIIWHTLKQNLHKMYYEVNTQLYRFEIQSIFFVKFWSLKGTNFWNWFLNGFQCFGEFVWRLLLDT